MKNSTPFTLMMVTVIILMVSLLINADQVRSGPYEFFRLVPTMRPLFDHPIIGGQRPMTYQQQPPYSPGHQQTQQPYPAKLRSQYESPPPFGLGLNFGIPGAQEPFQLDLKTSSTGKNPSGTILGLNFKVPTTSVGGGGGDSPEKKPFHFDLGIQG